MAAARRIFVHELGAAILGEEICICGWVTTVRRAKTAVFLEVRDRSGAVQVVCRPSVYLLEDDLDDLKLITVGSALRITGVVREPKEDSTKREIHLTRMHQIELAESPLPLRRNSNIQSRLDYRYLDLRDPCRLLIFKVRATLDQAMRQFLMQRDFLYIHTPKITGGGSESGANVFELPYFDGSAFLVQSMQFYGQLAMAAGFDRIFEIGPVFRAEKTISRRHATEFTLLHVEMAWISNEDDLMDLEEDLIRYMLEAVSEAHGKEIMQLLGIEIPLLRKRIPRIAACEAATEEHKSDGAHLSYRAERSLSKRIYDKSGHEFVFVTRYPASSRPFFAVRRSNRCECHQQDMTHSFDLLWRGIEITSGGLHEHRYSRLYAQAADAIAPEMFERYLDRYYLEMFRYGCPPHGGFGIGLDRFVMVLLAQSSLRETSFVFRGPERNVP